MYTQHSCLYIPVCTGMYTQGVYRNVHSRAPKLLTKLGRNVYQNTLWLVNPVVQILPGSVNRCGTSNLQSPDLDLCQVISNRCGFTPGSWHEASSMWPSFTRLARQLHEGLRVFASTGSEAPLAELHMAPIVECHVRGGPELQEGGGSAYAGG
jgi:hypothetical protein